MFIHLYGSPIAFFASAKIKTIFNPAKFPSFFLQFNKSIVDEYLNLTGLWQRATFI